MSTPENWYCETSEVPPKETCAQVSIQSLCELGWRPLLLTGFFRDTLIRKFHDPTQIEHADLMRYVWRDNERTGILIESVHRWRGDLVEKRPAVLVKRNPMKNMRVLLADLSGVTEKGFERYTQLWIGSHTLFCIHGTGASVEILATEVQRHFTRFSPVVRDHLGLLQFAVTEVGAIAEVEEATENFVVPITVGWAYQETWELQVESLPIKRIPLSIILECDEFMEWTANQNRHSFPLPPDAAKVRRGIARPGY